MQLGLHLPMMSRTTKRCVGPALAPPGRSSFGKRPANKRRPAHSVMEVASKDMVRLHEIGSNQLALHADGGLQSAGSQPRKTLFCRQRKEAFGAQSPG